MITIKEWAHMSWKDITVHCGNESILGGINVGVIIYPTILFHSVLIETCGETVFSHIQSVRKSNPNFSREEVHKIVLDERKTLILSEVHKWLKHTCELVLNKTIADNDENLLKLTDQVKQFIERK